MIYVFPASSWKITLANSHEFWFSGKWFIQWRSCWKSTPTIEIQLAVYLQLGLKILNICCICPLEVKDFVETTSPVNGLSSFRWGPTGVKLDLVGFASAHATSVARIPSDWSASDLSAWGHWMLHLMKYLLFGSRKGNCHRFPTTQITSLEVVAIFFVFGVSYKWEPKETKSTLPVYNLQSAGGVLTHFWHRKWCNLYIA